MQTDSVLDAQDREIMWRWGQPATREFFTENASNCFRIAGELSRLEQENQRLQARVDSLDCAHKLALGEVERLKENEDHLTRLAILGPALSSARAEVERLTTENTDLKEVASKLEVIVRSWRSHWEEEHEQLATTRDALTTARAEVHRLRLEAEGLEEVARRWQASWNVERNDLSAFRAEVQRLRENAEIDQAQRAEWQETIDKLEAENAQMRAQLEKPHDHGPVPMLTGINLTINGILERLSTLEGRVQGITEIVKQELAVIVERLRELEERVNRPSLVQEFVNSCTAEVRRLRAEMEQPVPPARNPFEDLRPPRGL